MEGKEEAATAFDRICTEKMVSLWRRPEGTEMQSGQWKSKGGSRMYDFDGEEKERGKRLSLPERTKQMGSIEPEVKIFLEDYVYTYLYQYGRSGGGREKLAVLVGKHYEIEGQKILVISGAIQAKGTTQENGMECFTEETWAYIGGQRERYFKGMELLGWVHCQPGFGAFLMARDEEFHGEQFSEPWQVLFVLDALDKLDTFYIYEEKGKGLRQAKGYFVYYDKNREMQEYMLENSMIRPREALSEEEREMPAEEDREPRRRKPKQEERMDAAQEIRRVLQKREQKAKQEKRQHDRLLAVVSGVLCLACICMGLAMMQSLERLRIVETELFAMKSSYRTLEEDVQAGMAQRVFAIQDTEEKEEAEEDAEGEHYIVESGDSLGYISRKYYGDNSGIPAIMEANGLEDANRIYEGQVLQIP